MNERCVVISIYDDAENPYYAGGGPAVVRRIAGALAEHYRVTVITAGRRPGRRSIDGIRYLYLPVLAAGPRGSQLLWAMLLPFAALVVPHALWLESFTPPLSSNLVPWFTRRPVVGLAQSLSARVMATRYRADLLPWLERFLLRGYRDIIVLNEHDAKAVHRAAPRTRVRVIANQVDPPGGTPTDAGTGTYAVYLGRIDLTLKGLDLLLAAYRQHPQGLAPLVIAGSGTPAQERLLTRLIADCRAPVRWVGRVDADGREELLAGSGFAVVPSRAESFSLSALEALSWGRPVVHFDLPQLSWIPDGCHASVRCFDVPALARAIAGYSGDPARRCVEGARALRFAERFHRQEQGGYLDLVRDRLADR